MATTCVAEVRKAESVDDLDAALRIEREVFTSRGYGEMPQDYDEQSTFYVAADAEGVIRGVIRMIGGSPLEMPALGLPIDDVWHERLGAVAPGRLVEYGALAVSPEAQARQGRAVAKALYRAGWRHTLHEDAEYSGMVMEPRRASAMARWHGLEFEQAGPTMFYMGGEVAAHFARPVDLLMRLGELNRPLHEFMVAGLHIDLTADGDVLSVQRSESR